MTTVSLTPQTSLLTTGEKLLVRHGEQVHTISGDAMVRLVESLVSTASDGVIPQPQVDPEAWSSLVSVLVDSGLVSVEPGMGDASPGARWLWQRSGQAYPLTTIHEALSQARVPVLGTHPVADRIRTILAEHGVQTTDDPGEAKGHASVEGSHAPAVVVADGIDDPILAEHNEWALAQGRPWLPVILDDAGRCVVGPSIRPHSSACFRCYALRRAANFPDRRIVQDLTTARPVGVDAPATDPMGLGWFVAALAVEKVVERIALGDHSTMSRPGGFAVLERSHPGVSVEEHRVLRVPRCPECSTTTERGLPQVWHHGGVSA